MIEVNAIDRNYHKCELMRVACPSGLTLNILMNNAMKLYDNAKQFYGYNAKTNNCQRFVFSLLLGSDLLTPKLEKYVLQDAETLLSGSKLLENIINFSTFLAEKGDILLHGGRIIS